MNDSMVKGRRRGKHAYSYPMLGDMSFTVMMLTRIVGLDQSHKRGFWLDDLIALAFLSYQNLHNKKPRMLAPPCMYSTANSECWYPPGKKSHYRKNRHQNAETPRPSARILRVKGERKAPLLYI